MEEYRNLDVDVLKALYEQHQKDLTLALLEGVDWKDVQDKRRRVTELSILLYHRTASANPAEYHFR